MGPRPVGLSDRHFAPKDNIARTRMVVCWPGWMTSPGGSMALYQWVATAEERSFKRANRSQSDLVDQAEKLALADLDEPLHIGALCRALCVSERTLRKAFHKTCGLAPCRHLRMLRLSEARCALLAADWRRVTVTEIATAFGFLELGRFSVEYRKVFGESPSQTLHGAG
jgi:transcriptional regulator GlxA family with amidase domain